MAGDAFTPDEGGLDEVTISGADEHELGAKADMIGAQPAGGGEDAFGAPMADQGGLDEQALALAQELEQAGYHRALAEQQAGYQYQEPTLSPERLDGLIEDQVSQAMAPHFGDTPPGQGAEAGMGFFAEEDPGGLDDLGMTAERLPATEPELEAAEEFLAANPGAQHALATNEQFQEAVSMVAEEYGEAEALARLPQIYQFYGSESDQDEAEADRIKAEVMGASFGANPYESDAFT